MAANQPATPQTPPKSVVYCIENNSAITDYQDSPAAVKKMVDYVVMATTETHDVASAWRSLVKPTDRIGIKISAAGGKLFSTHKSVVEAIVQGLESAGIDRKNVIVWDRQGTAAAGYSNRSGYQVRNIEPAQGYDPEAVITSGILGKLIWGDLDFARRSPDQKGIVPSEKEQVSQDSHLCKILTREVTKIINVPVLTTSEDCGIAGCLYNVTVPNVDNWRRFAGGNDSFICDLYEDERIGNRVVINIMDGLIAQYAGGPEFEPNYAFAHGTIYASKDPVALDAVALTRIEEWRSTAKLPRISPYAAYLRTASAMGIGAITNDKVDVRMVRPGE